MDGTLMGGIHGDGTIHIVGLLLTTVITHGTTGTIHIIQTITETTIMMALLLITDPISTLAEEAH